MSVKHNKNGGGNTAALEKEVQEVKAAGESTAALLAMSFKAQIVQDLSLIHISEPTRPY